MKVFFKTVAFIFICLCFALLFDKAQAQALNEVEKIGNPGLSQFPANTPCDCQARGVKDMQYYKGRIYVGYGDLGYGGPPPLYCAPHVSVRLWQIDSSGSLSVALQTYDEEVRYMLVEEGKLFISPADTNLPEALIWIFDGAKWQKASLAGANKLTLQGFFKGGLYVAVSQSTGGLSVGKLFKSSDLGKNWKVVLDYGPSDLLPGKAISMGSFLLMMGAKKIDPAHPGIRKSVIFKWHEDDSYDLYEVEYPLQGRNSIAYQLSRFRDGVVYALRYEYYGVPSHNAELLFLNQFYEGGAARALSGFPADKNVVDVIVKGGTVYVLSITPWSGSKFKGHIYSSDDLDNWAKQAEFIVPAQPYAFEMMDATGDFYVGLGDRNPYEGYADPEAGSIYKILDTEAPPPTNEPPEITILGDSPLEHIRGNVYIDPGAVAYDVEDGDLTPNIVISGDTLKLSSPQGSYQVIYQVVDSGGLTSTETRTVEVKEGPMAPPSSASIVVEVVDESTNQPLQGVKVSLYDTGGNDLGKFCNTNNSGQGLLANLTAGEDYSYRAEKPGYTTAEGSFTAGFNMPPVKIALTQAGTGQLPGMPPALALDGDPCCYDSDCGQLLCQCAGTDCQMETVNNERQITKGRGGICLPPESIALCPASEKGIGQIISDVLKWLSYFGFSVAVLMIIFGAWVLLTASGAQQRVVLGKSIITWSLIGLTFLILSRVIVGLILNIFK